MAAKPTKQHDQYTAIDRYSVVPVGSGDRELFVSGDFNADGQLTYGYAGLTRLPIIEGQMEETSTLTGETFEMNAAFVYGDQQDGEDSAAEAGEPGSSAGTMTVSGNASASGDPLVIDYRNRNGNSWSFESGTTQDLAGSATVTAATGDLSGALGAELTCSGRAVDVTYRSSNPTSYVSQFSWFHADCALPREPAISTFDPYGWATGRGEA